jgi:hypothetical protein
VLDFYVAVPKEVVILGPREAAATRALVNTVFSRFLPNKVLVGAESAQTGPSSPLLEDRALVAGKPTAYVCQRYVCQLPVTDPQALAEQLES